MANNLFYKLLKSNYFKWILVGMAFIAFVIIYLIFNPYINSFFPTCLFYQYTGLKCPICGTQRAIHFLLNVNILEAAKENLLFVLSVPYLALYAYFVLIKPEPGRNKLKLTFLFGKKAKYVVALAVLIFWFVRNIFDF
jgi:hypothetical protein